MNKKNGFTLVELMVVIVIIGVLAAVAIPKMMAATAKARASEGPQILGAIERLQHAYRAETGIFLECEKTVNATPSTNSSGWQRIGMDDDPFSKYFNFAVDFFNDDPTTFDAKAIVYGNLTSRVDSGDELVVSELGKRTAENENLANLVVAWEQGSSGRNR